MHPLPESKPGRSTSLGRRSFIVLSACLLVPTIRSAVQAADGRPFVIGTSTPGGGFALYGDMLERVLNRRAGRLLIRARLTRGTTENLDLLHTNGIDAALIQGTAASEIFQASSTGELRILFAMYPSPGMLAVPAASRVTRLEDVLGQRVVFGVRTSGLVTLGRQVSPASASTSIAIFRRSTSSRLPSRRAS